MKHTATVRFVGGVWDGKEERLELDGPGDYDDELDIGGTTYHMRRDRVWLEPGVSHHQEIEYSIHGLR